MKICIELDEEMRECWDDAKENLEETIERLGDTQNETKVSLTDSQIPKGILREWRPISYLCVFNREEIELMKKQKRTTITIYDGVQPAIVAEAEVLPAILWLPFI